MLSFVSFGIGSPVFLKRKCIFLGGILCGFWCCEMEGFLLVFLFFLTFWLFLMICSQGDKVVYSLELLITLQKLK